MKPLPNRPFLGAGMQYLCEEVIERQSEYTGYIISALEAVAECWALPD